MKRIYRKIISLLLSFISFVEIKKSLMFEIIDINRKKYLYKDVKWSREQQSEFDTYWKKMYGKKISPKWHKLYQSINGKFCVEYLPEIFYTTKIEPKFNSFMYSKVLADKNLLETLFSNKIDGVRTPCTYVHSNMNLFFDKNNEPVSYNDLTKILNNVGSAVIKPTVDTSSGQGVRIVYIVNGIDQNTGDTIEKIIKEYKTNFTVQERIKPHPAFENLYPNSVNTVRIITYICKNKIYNAPLSLRVGSGGGVVDNIHAGGMVVGLSDEGFCRSKAYVLGNCDNKLTHTKHPDTQVVFDGYEIPMVEKMITSAKKLHGMTSHIGFISWDMTLNSDNEIIIIEANYRGQSVWFPQVVNECGIFGENTKDMLDLIKKNYA